MTTILKKSFKISGADLKDAMRERDARHNEMVEELVQAAISALHHDTTEGSEVDKYERQLLRTKFGQILSRATS
jgi:hypothetical protein